MAGNLIMSISQDERERAIFRSRRKFETDYASDITTAEDRGRASGRLERNIEIAQNLLRRNRPIDEIIEDTGLSHEEIVNIQNSIQS